MDHLSHLNLTLEPFDLVMLIFVHIIVVYNFDVVE